MCPSIKMAKIKLNNYLKLGTVQSGEPEFSSFSSFIRNMGVVISGAAPQPLFSQHFIHLSFVILEPLTVNSSANSF